MKLLNIATKLIASFAVLACNCSSMMAQTNYIVNGTFSTGTTYSVLGWTLGGGSSLNNKNGDPTPCLDLGGTATQTISDLTIGGTYTISGNYYTTTSDSTTLMLEILIDGVAVAEYSGTAMTWESFTYDYTATESSITLNFTRIGGNACLIDNITMYAVPEPSTVALLALGLGAIGLARRKVQK
jgi:hypothetical protein